MEGWREEIPKYEKHNYNGDAARQVAIIALGDHGTFIRALSKDFTMGGVCINGRFAYTKKRNSLKAGRKKQKHMLMADEG